MNIYHITLNNWDYDQYDSFVVIAEDEDHAKELIANIISIDQKIEEISCIGIANSSISEIVLSSFNAG